MGKSFKPGARVGEWTLQPDPETKGAIKSNPHPVWWVTRGAQRGVLKYCGKPSARKAASYLRKRFVTEFELMQRLNGTDGVLALLDSDSSGAKEWFVTQAAVLLATHLGESPNLWDVVAATAELASALVEVAEAEKVNHRDIKPDNLSWLNGRAVLGDFGLAHHGDDFGLTGVGVKVGPWGYMAPEALNNDRVDDWGQSDVFSLTKCLWKLAMGQSYPPQGPLWVFDRSNSLYPAGGDPALELIRLLERCTLNGPLDRPRMKDLRDELRCWLRRYPPESVIRPEPHRFRHWNEPGADLEKAARLGENAIADHCVRRILNRLRTSYPGSSILDVTADSPDLSPDVLGRVTGGNPDYSYDFVATLSLEWESEPAVRLVVEGIGEWDEAHYYGEWQCRPAPRDAWQSASPLRYATGTLWYPTDFDARDSLAQRFREDAPLLA